MIFAYAVFRELPLNTNEMAGKRENARIKFAARIKFLAKYNITSPINHRLTTMHHAESDFTFLLRKEISIFLRFSRAKRRKILLV